MTLLGGRIGDIPGRRDTFVLGVAGAFTAGAIYVACALLIGIVFIGTEKPTP
nr:hypothetical protein GCM10020063_052280 [Dactylosporangium thailandense]